MYYATGWYYEEAASCFKNASAIDDTEIRVKAYTALGYTCQLIGDKVSAESYLSKAIALNPDYTRAYDLRGEVYVFDFSLEKAIEDFNIVIAKEPKNGHAYQYRGMAYSFLGEDEKADNDQEMAEKYGGIVHSGYIHSIPQGGMPGVEPPSGD